MNLFKIFMFSMNAILPLICIIVLGYVLKKKGFFSKEFLKNANKLVFRVLLPVLLFCNVTNLESLDGIPWNAVIYVVCIVAVLVILGLIVAHFTPKTEQKGVMLQCIFRSNFALIGIPLADLIGGSQAVTVAAILSVFTIPLYNILSVIALTMYQEDGPSFSIKKQLEKIAKNPLILGVLAGLVVLVLKCSVGKNITPEISNNFSFINKTLQNISKAATPMALLVLGGQFEFNRIQGYRKQIIVAVLGRTLFSPLIGIGAAICLTKSGIVYFSPAVFAAFISLFGTPVAVASAIMAEEMGNDGQLAAQLVVWTSLISVFTTFGVIFLSRLFGVI